MTWTYDDWLDPLYLWFNLMDCPRLCDVCLDFVLHLSEFIDPWVFTFVSILLGGNYLLHFNSGFRKREGAVTFVVHLWQPPFFHCSLNSHATILTMLITTLITTVHQLLPQGHWPFIISLFMYLNIQWWGYEHIPTFEVKGQWPRIIGQRTKPL